MESREHSCIVIPSGCDTVAKVKSIDCSTVTNDPEGVDFDTLISDFDLSSSSEKSIEFSDPFEDFEVFLKKQQKVRNMMQRPTDIDITPLLSPSSMSSPFRAYNRGTSKGNQTPRGKYDLSPRSSGIPALTPATPEFFRSDSSENIILKPSTPGSTTSDQVENAEHFFHQLLQRYSSKTPQQTPTKQ
ncbi:predicted protein [Naegleria gruberi]|uniref:Predicted protein n=1 Tax=Naegleria gruberi TaxID=5762 RepID=D2W1F2_NAEGR|nr:uncharacterized protein NAEGRDRAFT_75195 [Naegleria gruberi]EFC37078.1 predicted protein [Naegleria gruberi]|eukprot:XP_002669822.1 predicted protein [Naegleria gruberi strain NEG-M]